MIKEDRWYDLKIPTKLGKGGDDEKVLFRIVPFDTLLQMLNEGVNYLVKIKHWEDVYENFILKEIVNRGGKKTEDSTLENMFYGQCWSRRFTSDAMWRIYSPDKKSVRIKTKLGKLRKMTTPNNGTLIVDQVRYYSQGVIEDDLRESRNLSINEVVPLIIQSLFTKRKSFIHEAEYRAIYVPNTLQEDIKVSAKKFSITPLDFIDNIYFDPRADDVYVSRCTNILTKAFNYPKSRIKKSGLYSFTSPPISFEKCEDDAWDSAIQNWMKVYKK